MTNTIIFLIVFILVIKVVIYPYLKGFLSAFRKDEAASQRQPAPDQPEDGLIEPQDTIGDAIEAMVALGYKKKYSQQVISQITQKEYFGSAQEIIKAALKKINQG